MADARPTFIIGGAPRAGTNFLCHALDRHPDVYLAKPYLPEPKVFMGPEQPWDVYAARYAAFFAPAGPRRALGEKTTYYLENEACCALIRRHLPAVRMVFILREPVARAYSNYLWTKKNGLETLPFEEAVRLEGRRASPLPPERDYARPYDYVVRGQYDVFAERWYAATRARARRVRALRRSRVHARAGAGEHPGVHRRAGQAAGRRRPRRDQLRQRDGAAARHRAGSRAARAPGARTYAASPRSPAWT